MLSAMRITTAVDRHHIDDTKIRNKSIGYIHIVRKYVLFFCLRTYLDVKTVFVEQV
jgi:hypothetical protein